MKKTGHLAAGIFRSHRNPGVNRFIGDCRVRAIQPVLTLQPQVSVGIELDAIAVPVLGG